MAAGLLALALAAGHLWLFANLPATFVDGPYRQRIYRPLLGVLRSLTDPLPWSLGGALLLILGLFLAWRLLRLLASLPVPGFTLRALAASGRLLVLLSLLIHPFLCFWGYHYRATPLAARLGLEPPGPAAIAALASAALSQTTALREPGLSRASGPLPPLGREVARSLEELGLGALPLPGRLKPPPIPGLLGIAGTLGIICPFTLEAHLEPALHWTDALVLGAHELAHLGGVAGEAEASLVAWHALTTSAHPLHRYAGWLGMLHHLAPPEGLAPETRADLEAARAARRSMEWAPFAAFSRQVYDLYLKGQGLPAGVADYGRVAGLAAAWLARRKDG